MAVLAAIDGNVWVNRVVAAYATPIVETRRREIGARYFLVIFMLMTLVLYCDQVTVKVGRPVLGALA